MGKDFETEVLTRLAVIENKIDDYKTVKQKTDDAFKLANDNKQDIDEINDKIRWISRTITASIIALVIGAIAAIIKMV